MKIPRPMALVADFDPRVASDHAVLNCQNCGSVEVDPCHLKGKSTVVTFSIFWSELFDVKTVVSRYYLVTLFSSIPSNDSYATVSVIIKGNDKMPSLTSTLLPSYTKLRIYKCVKVGCVKSTKRYYHGLQLFNNNKSIPDIAFINIR